MYFIAYYIQYYDIGLKFVSELSSDQLSSDQNHE